ncbi:DcaP family trimeric outer membrane transporter [Haliangium ochraceum]|nr:DcaP family trimeric outer membrane transporter [Haliangium ochraceum]
MIARRPAPVRNWLLAAAAAALVWTGASGTAHAQSEDESGTTFRWGGYVKLDVMYSTSSLGGASNLTDYAIIPGAVPVPESEGGGNFNLNARESRFWFATTTPSSYGDIGTLIELDFVGFDASLGNERTSSPSTPRLRHAYGTWNGFMIGQGWSTWMDLEALPEKNDFGSPAGRSFARQALIRYTHAIEGVGDLQVAIENPETTLTGTDGARIVPSDDLMPDTVAKFTYRAPWGHAAAAGIVRGISVDSAVADEKDFALGFGGRLSGKIMLGDKNNLRLDATAGRGVGRYIAFNAYNDGELTADGEIELIDVVATLLSAQVWLDDNWRINLVGSASQALNNDEALGGSTKRLLSTHANVMVNITPSLRLALEHIFITRELENEADGALHRVQGSFRFTF